MFFIYKKLNIKWPSLITDIWFTATCFISVYAFHLKHIYFWFYTHLHFYEHEKVAAYSDGHVRVFELLDPLELTNWQLQVKLDCSTFSELKNAVLKILLIINQHVFFILFFICRLNFKILLNQCLHLERLCASLRLYLWIPKSVVARNSASL